MVIRRDKFINLEHRNKLSAKWEGPYKIVKIMASDLFYLKDMEGIKLPCPLNVEHLNDSLRDWH